MTIAVLTLAVGPSPEDLARCYLRSHKDAYKRFSALLRRPAFANFWCSVAPSLSLNPKGPVQSI